MTDSILPTPAPSLIVDDGRPLIGIPAERNGQPVTVFFSDEATSSSPDQDAIQRALGAIGAWRHLDWDEAERELDRIRHQSKPTPPIEDL